MNFAAKHPTALFQDLGRDYFNQLLTASAAGEEGFRARYLPMAEKLAMMLQELPLEKETYSQPGGALKFGLLAGLAALRLCDGVIFMPGVTAQIRMVVEPQYRWAAWCATLASIPLVVAHNASIKVNGQPWSFADASTLWESCGKNGSYKIDWMPSSPNRPSAALGTVVLSQFFFPGQFSAIEPVVLLGLCEAINPALVQSPAEQALSRVVRVAQEKVRQSERLRMTQVFSPSRAGGAITVEMLASLDSDVQVVAGVSPSALPEAATPIHGQQVPVGVTGAAGGTNQDVKKQISQKILAWVRAIAAEPEMADKFKFVPAPGVGILLSAKTLKFGFATASEGYSALHEGGLVLEKREREVLANEDLAQAFRAALESKSHA